MEASIGNEHNNFSYKTLIPSIFFTMGALKTFHFFTTAKIAASFEKYFFVSCKGNERKEEA